VCRQVCQEDIEQTCGRQFQTLDQTHNDDGRVIKCLQDFKDELKVPPAPLIYSCFYLPLTL